MQQNNTFWLLSFGQIMQVHFVVVSESPAFVSHCLPFANNYANAFFCNLIYPPSSTYKFRYLQPLLDWIENGLRVWIFVPFYLSWLESMACNDRSNYCISCIALCLLFSKKTLLVIDSRIPTILSLCNILCSQRKLFYLFVYSSTPRYPYPSSFRQEIENWYVA